eukprot:TRINITY_DN3026_c0_g1_i1.p1 TRINITY_DN3026_c0_g1~~TRINITY_DN3026_c0_g1_i1.p1  ORF type:complete len:659 (+),score=46.83 TRINITY_DN3026_c0_g1_i1:17-1993(+)
MLVWRCFVLCLFCTTAVRRETDDEDLDDSWLFGKFIRRRRTQGASKWIFSPRRRTQGAGKSLTLKETTSKCGKKTHLFVDAIVSHWVSKYQGKTQSVGKWFYRFFSSAIWDKDKRSEPLPEGVADKFTVSWYAVALHYSLRIYARRYANSVHIPTKVGNGDVLKIGKIEAPFLDIDYPPVRESPVLPSFDCIQNILRTMPFEDALEDNVSHPNNWKSILSESGGKFKTKREWVDSYYKYYTMKSGERTYPLPQIDFRQYFRRGNTWDDDLEKAIAFSLIGAHRVEENRISTERETLPWCLLLNSASEIPVRHGFGTYGADMYFSKDGLPALIITPFGRKVVPDDKDWGYWKFVWRSTLLALVTLVDHLHFSHFRVGNIFARASRQALPAKHPLRRLLSIFTFGTIEINSAAMHTLVGPNHALHRATAFKSFECLSEVVPTYHRPIIDEHKHFFNETEWNALPAILSTSPYFQDGRHLFSALATFVRRYLKHVANLCDANDEVIDRKALDFLGVLAILEKDASYAHEKCRTCTCITNLFIGAAWTVTGFHRQVGQVAGYADPDLASFSWKSGELFGRPRQYLMQSMIAATTAKAQPKLTEDYSHVFKGMDGDATLAKQIWHEFQEQLAEVRETVRKNNMDREVKNFQADPDLVECSIAV